MSVDIKATYGAHGDGQIATTLITMSSTVNPTHLTVSTALFVVGDVGKSIAISLVGPAGGPYLTTIASFTDSQHVVLTDPCSTTVVASSGLIEWGNDDTTAFAAFNTANNGGSNVTLTIPAGRYCFANGPFSLAIGTGIQGLSVIGTGGPTLTDMLDTGVGFAINAGTTGKLVLYNDNTAESYVQTVGAGATVLNMLTPADAGKYSVNTWAWMTGYDTQGFGSPPNPAFAEFVFIIATDAVAGTVTIQTPLKYSYKSDWPEWVLGSAGSGTPNYTGGAFSLGGPAKLYLINSVNWDGTHVWDGVNFRSSGTVFNCDGKNITIKNSLCEVFGPNVSFQHECVIDNISVLNTEWELDKATDFFTMSNSTVHSLKSQSRSPFNVTLNNVTINNSLNGVSANWTLNNCSLPGGSLIYPIAYGGADTIAFNNTTFTTTDTYSAELGVGEDDIAGVGAWSISNGLMSRPKSSGTGEPPQWAIPGSYFGFHSRYTGMAPVWKCLDIYQTGNTLFLQTDQTVSAFPPTVNGGAGSVGVNAVISKLLSYSGNTGSPSATGWQGNRLFSHWLQTYTGNIGAATAANLIQIWGQVVFIKVTVNAGYSAGTMDLDAFVLQKPSNNDTVWNPIFDLTVSGTRIITPSGVTGSVGSDSGLTLPNSGNVWLVSNQITPEMTGAVGSGSVIIEIQTDQGFPAANAGWAQGLLRCRWHS